MIKATWSNEKVRYVVIGLFNTGLGYFLFAMLWLMLHALVHYIFILLISHAISVTSAYWCYRKFVFRKSDGGLSEYIRFNSVYIGSLSVNFFCLPLLVEVGKLHPLIAQGMVMGFTVITSYFLHKHYSFGLTKANDL